MIDGRDLSLTDLDITDGTHGQILQTDGAGNFSFIDIRSSGTSGTSVWNESSGNIHRSSGNVGIGTNNPTSKLDVVGNLTCKGDLIKLNDINDNVWLKLNKNISELKLHGNKINLLGGNVGVGVENPATKLEVAAGTNRQEVTDIAFFLYNRGFVSASFESIGLQNVCAIFGSSIWIKTGVVGASSDERIKKNIRDINDNGALQKILQIQPKKYNYKDPIKRGTYEVYGFIAQQVNEIVPNAVNTSNVEVIPDIMTIAHYDCDSNVVESNILTHKISFDCNVDLSIGDTVEIITENNKDKYEILADLGCNIYQIDKSIDSSNIFVYGKEVNDFHTIDKSYIYTLNVCATQELHRMIEAQKEMIDHLKIRIQALENNQKK